jgi:hypothetical protein
MSGKPQLELFAPLPNSTYGGLPALNAKATLEAPSAKAALEFEGYTGDAWSCSVCGRQNDHRCKGMINIECGVCGKRRSDGNMQQQPQATWICNNPTHRCCMPHCLAGNGKNEQVSGQATSLYPRVCMGENCFGCCALWLENETSAESGRRLVATNGRACISCLLQACCCRKGGCFLDWLCSVVNRCVLWLIVLVVGITLLAIYFAAWKFDSAACDTGEPGAWTKANCTVTGANVIQENHCSTRTNCRDRWLVEVGVQHGAGASATAYWNPSQATAGTRCCWVYDQSRADVDVRDWEAKVGHQMPCFFDPQAAQRISLFCHGDRLKTEVFLGFGFLGASTVVMLTVCAVIGKQRWCKQERHCGCNRDKNRRRTSGITCSTGEVNVTVN